MSESDELTKQLEKNLDRLEYELDESARALEHARFEARHFEQLASFRGHMLVAGGLIAISGFLTILANK